MRIFAVISIASLFLSSCAAPIVDVDSDPRCKTWPPIAVCVPPVEKAYLGPVRDRSELASIVFTPNSEDGLEALLHTVREPREGGLNLGWNLPRRKIELLPGRYAMNVKCKQGRREAYTSMELKVDAGTTYEIRCRYAPGDQEKAGPYISVIYGHAAGFKQ